MTGRNDPCPCGSGKKFKKCCLGKEAGPPVAYTASDRQSAWGALGRFASRAEFAGERAVAEVAFWGDLAGRLPAKELPPLMAESRLFFEEWFLCDFRLRDGRTFVDLFLERQGGRLRAGELRYLERVRHAHLRPYEVVGVKLDEGLELLDLWTGTRMRVQERLGTHQLVQWDILGARIILGPSGVPVIQGSPYRYPARTREAILKDLRRAYRKFKRAIPGIDLVTFFKRMGRVFYLFWLDHVALRPLPKMITPEGDEMAFGKATFDVQDAGALSAALANHPDLHRQDDGSYVWHEAAGDLLRGVAVFVPEGDRLVLEAISETRLQRGRQFLESLAGGAVTHRATSYESVKRAMERRPREAEKPEPEIPPEVQARVVGEFYERHYRDWPDTALPALGGRTPREAAGQARWRSRVSDLLKQMENMSARQRLSGRPAYDFGWMWAELGLERPG
jgi:hypothetical protein